MMLCARGIATVAVLLSTAGTALAQNSQVTIYATNPVQAIETVEEIARTNVPDIRLNAITGGSGVLLRRIESEARQVQADVFWSASTSTLGAFEHLFTAHESEHLLAIPESLHYPGNLFSPTNVHVAVLMVNTQQLGDLPMPQSWSDLLNPAYIGKIVIVDPANSSTGYAIAWGLSELLEPASFEALVRNLIVTGTSAGVPRGVAQGEYAIGLTFESQAYPYVDGGQEEIELVYPSDGTFISPEYLGLIKGAPAGDFARTAFDHLLSRETQAALLQSSFRRPSRTDINVSEYIDLPEIGDITVFEIDEAKAAAERDTFLELWQALGAAKDE